MKFDFTGLLKNEMKPALGVTEVGAIALAAARAYAAVGGKLQEIRMVMNGGMYKNSLFLQPFPARRSLAATWHAAWCLGWRLVAWSGDAEKYYSRTWLPRQRPADPMDRKLI